LKNELEQISGLIHCSTSKAGENNPFALNIADLAFPHEKDGFFSKPPGVVALCIVVLTRTLGSAGPVPQDDDDANDGGLASLTAPAVEGLVNPLTQEVVLFLPRPHSGTQSLRL